MAMVLDSKEKMARIHLSHGAQQEFPKAAHGALVEARFKGIRKGRQVVLIDLAHGQGFIILPMSTLSGVEQQQLLRLVEGRWPQANQGAMQNTLPMQK